MRPQLGDFGVVATHGWEAKVIRWGTESSVNHAFVYIGGGQIVEARPGGAAIASARKYPTASWSSEPLGDMARRRIASGATQLVGTPYGWLDIAAIALAQRRLGDLVDPLAPLHAQPWAIRRVQSLHTLICSQLVDVAYQGAGVHLFNDGRVPGLVSPGDLLEVIRHPARIR
jgi:hypothetical protein